LSKPKTQTEGSSEPCKPCALFGKLLWKTQPINGRNCFTNPEKNKRFPLNQSLTRANRLWYLQYMATCDMQSSVRWMTDAFTWSPLLRLFVKCLPSLSPREQPLPISHVALGRTIFHAGTKSARPSTFLQPLRPYYLGYNRRSMSDGRKLLIPSTSRTLAARRGAPSTNILASLDGPLACAPPRETHRLATLEERGTQDRGPRGHQARQQRAVRPMEYSNT